MRCWFRYSITDATASARFGLLTEGLLAFGPVTTTHGCSVGHAGTHARPYGISRANGTTLSLIHALGHGLTRTDDVQQGAAHGILLRTRSRTSSSRSTAGGHFWPTHSGSATLTTLGRRSLTESVR